MTRDKVLHVIAGFVIAAGVGLLANPPLGLLAALVAGIGKEALDAYGLGTVDGGDFNATAAGGVAGMLAAMAT